MKEAKKGKRRKGRKMEIRNRERQGRYEEWKN
jgi:hypothetical protein